MDGQKPLVFALGSNGSGQLGIGHKEDVSVPKPAIFHPNTPDSVVIQYATGGNHTLLLFQSGELFYSGDSSTGACGLVAQSEVPVFREVRLRRGNERFGTIVQIAATWEASFILSLDEDGKRTKLYSFGIGMKGELGLGELIIRTPEATQIKDFPPPNTQIIELSAAMGHVVTVLDNGDAYGWGNCRKGQAGEPSGVIAVPRKIEGIGFEVKRAVCCKETTCFLGEPEEGRIAVLGSDKGKLKSEAPNNVRAWKDISSSWGNIFILKEDGSLHGWGRDDQGQIPPPNVSPLSKIAAGSEHVVALTKESDVISWGWGEHGNCGPTVENNVVKGRWNILAASRFLPPSTYIHSIGAGCATSWVCIASLPDTTNS